MSQTIDIIGAGLTGPLMAIYLSRKGFKVRLHEGRDDMRKAAVGAGRSINLALTARGMQSLDEVGLKEPVMQLCIPMTGRMVHDLAGKTVLQPYGQTAAEVIYAVSRGRLNMLLLDAAAANKNVEIFFNRRCRSYDVDSNTLVFDDSGVETKVQVDVVIGADGAWSPTRRGMMAKLDHFNYAQEYLDYDYKELTIPPAKDGGFRIARDVLHIWPHKSFMMIALPNTEGSFTCTLFYPRKGPGSFETLNTPAAVEAFFNEKFPDAAAHMPDLTREFFSNPTGALVTVKCSPWHARGKAVLVGDAAHALVPFFAQGMNSGFEDCRVLNGLIAADEKDWEGVFTRFTAARKANADAIADMAVENFIEMRDLVTDPHFILKKKVGFELEKRWPGKFIPRYSMVVFRADIPYAEAQRRGRLQDKVLEKICANISSPEQVDWEKAGELLQNIA
ncbi:MAG: NAD(P)/FAD-dependent oxidoreductase [Micavibrio sp.]|nr:NAD(P)/FAD-dependent oxidoreductase [Micavibrio sp.]